MDEVMEWKSFLQNLLSMQIPAGIHQTLNSILPDKPVKFSPATGGCINHGGELRTTQKSYFLKWNDSKRFPSMFKEEARGLNLLRSTQAVAIPEVVTVGEVDGIQFLLLEFIKEGRRRTDYWEQLGAQLASMHRHSNSMFGLDHDNYIGSLQQFNTSYAKWVDFFIKCRLMPQLTIGEQSGSISFSLRKKFDTLLLHLNELMPQERPALIHGDLWSGNLLTDEAGSPCLIDPAVYYGNREAELAFTQLFGGFDEAFLHAYQQAFPLHSGFQDRIEIYNLYPLLVHVNLFGGTYLQSVERVLRRYQ